jgi:ubiquinone/menaquinone biosynthesis C-methylase UbiE
VPDHNHDDYTREPNVGSLGVAVERRVVDPRTELVGRGYDAIGERFAEWRDRVVGDPRREWEEELVSRLQGGGRVLELGCGAGVPDTQRLAARFRVTGVDISAEQVRRARSAVPQAEFVQADFTALELVTGPRWSVQPL